MVVALAIYQAVAVDRLAGLPLAVGAAATVVFLVGIVGVDARALPFAFALLGVEYGIFLWLRHERVGAGTVAYAAALVLASELAYWSLELRSAADEATLLRRRATTVGATVVGAFLVASAVAAAADLRVGSGLEFGIVGAAALLAALYLVARLARS